ncbi:MAG: class I SAM-dependent methyltransferase [Proteobacteria bacterium]|nr:class I SAM-dependent methyltransferase [Pseudomonadota bacterium]
MRREKLFSKHGFYPFIVESNVLLHREAIEYGSRVVGHLLSLREDDRPVAVLDLACGGQPVSIAQMMGNFPDTRFHYTGIDINPDQVEEARSAFRYPLNVDSARIIEGNAWDPRNAGLKGRYDLIFMGMNLHHGTPEEVYYLVTQLQELIRDIGVFISHDWYRPDDEPYLRRPDHHPDNPAESFQLVDQATLASLAIPSIVASEAKNSGDDPHWRVIYRNTVRDTLIERGGEVEGAKAGEQHMRLRDYPISLEELRTIVERVGVKAKILHYGDNDILTKFTAMPVLSRSAAVLAAL